ncbi:MAG: hypothetical protein ABIU95_05890, partial [Burkholderiales bacterium]
DKLTLVCDAVLAPLAPWIEQLVAESLGKHGKGLIPIIGERLETPDHYADDRVFVRLARVAGSAVKTDDPTTRELNALAAAGHPVVTLEVGPTLAAEFVRWSVATAVAGHVLGVNPFDQPDVEAAKHAARALATEYEAHGTLQDDRPTVTSEGIALYLPAGATRLTDAGAEAANVLGEFLAKVARRDYLAILAFIEMNPTHDAVLATLRSRLRSELGIATTIGYGPRYLHSSGQLHKGGPESGVFIIVTCDEGADLAVPGQRATFGVVKLAQARGDFNALASRGRRVLRVHVGADVRAGLRTFTRMIDRKPG